MVDLLPSSITDDDMRIFDQVVEERFEGIDLAAALVNLLNGGPEAALPALGWQFGAIDQVWNSASTAERKAYLKKIIARRKIRGTLGAVEQALEAIGYPTTALLCTPRPELTFDGSWSLDGTFTFGAASRFLWWFVVVGPALSPSEQARVVAAFEAWKRKSAHLDGDGGYWYRVPTSGDVGDLSKYERFD